MAQVLGALMAVLVFCLCLTCCQYKKVSAQYEAIRQTESANSQIVQKNKKAIPLEERPRKRGSANESGDTELGDLDVDFA